MTVFIFVYSCFWCTEKLKKLSKLLVFVTSKETFPDDCANKVFFKTVHVGIKDSIARIKGSLSYRIYPQETSMCVCGGGGGGGLTAGTFLYDTWENSIILLKKFGFFGNILERDIK